MSISEERKRALKEPFIDLVSQVKHVHMLNHLYVSMISRHRERNEIVSRAAALLQRLDGPVASDEIPDWGETAIDDFGPFVEEEIRASFFSVLSNEIVYFRTLLESSIFRFVRVFIQSESELVGIKEFSELKLTFVEIYQKSEDEIKDLLAEVYIDKRGFGKSYGFDKFEAVLEPLIGHSGLKSDFKSGLFHFARLRNLLVHRNGIADLAFAKRTNRKQVVVGERIRLSAEDSFKCLEAALEYSLEIRSRIEKM